MGWHLWLCWMSCLLLNCLLFANCFNTSSLQLSCHDDERSALLQFKQSFAISRSASSYEDAYPKVLSWKSEGESSNCCSWDGVECDEKTGHVIGLILNSSCLYGSIDSNSSLFRLVHLQKLNLADNHFNYSLIPSAIGQFSGLTYLNLSNSRFYGQIPSKISHLFKLTFLDLSTKFDLNDPSKSWLLELINPSLTSLIQNLTSLEQLRLTSVYMPSTVSNFLANFTSLQSLFLQNCGLYGEFPTKIFHLPNLQVLKLGFNKNLSGYLPEFHQRSPLQVLVLSETSFSGSIPSSVEKLESLQYLYLQRCKFSSPLPSSLGKLTLLTDLLLQHNHFCGQIPYSLGNLTQLVMLSLDTNEFHGSIPHSLSKLLDLQFLCLHRNNLNGTVDFDMFSSMRSLVFLDLGYNKFSLLFDKRSINATTSKFMGMGLASCNLSVFPYFFQYQNELEFLDLSDNKIHGEIPQWMWNTSLKTLAVFLLGGNFLVDFRQPSREFLPWNNLWELDLSDNMLQGKLPIPPNSIRYYQVSNNQLTGEITLTICNLSSICWLDFSFNNFSGLLPQCLGKFNSLIVLQVRNNSFHGAIPQLCTRGIDLKTMDLSHNKFEGQLPRSLAACLMLESLNLAKNQLIDVFPSWLGTLPELKLLSLRDNQFYGAIREPKHDIQFPKLRVIDISNNNFIGNLPSEYIRILNSMKAIKTVDSGYMKMDTIMSFLIDTKAGITFSDRYSTTIVNKGVERYYAAIQENFAYIDFSCNKFNGEIPQFIGSLKALRSLNLSFNNLTGGIPSSLGNLTDLESLDLSNNKLSGEIPPELTQLTFLQSFDVSHNNLTGPIPRGSQFQTFENVSFEGNPGLCGDPLSKKCEDSKVLPPPPLVVEENDDSGSPIELDRKFVLAGCISGFIVGVVLGDMVITKRWFLKTFRRIPRRNEIRQRFN